MEPIAAPQLDRLNADLARHDASRSAVVQETSEVSWQKHIILKFRLVLGSLRKCMVLCKPKIHETLD